MQTNKIWVNQVPFLSAILTQRQQFNQQTFLFVSVKASFLFHFIFCSNKNELQFAEFEMLKKKHEKSKRIETTVGNKSDWISFNKMVCDALHQKRGITNLNESVRVLKTA